MTPPEQPNRAIAWWESLETWLQVAIAFPVLAVVLFVANLAAFNQPLLRSIFYGLFEGGVATGLLIAATLQEKSKRRQR